MTPAKTLKSPLAWALQQASCFAARRREQAGPVCPWPATSRHFRTGGQSSSAVLAALLQTLRVLAWVCRATGWGPFCSGVRQNPRAAGDMVGADLRDPPQDGPMAARSRRQGRSVRHDWRGAGGPSPADPGPEPAPREQRTPQKGHEA